MEVFISMNDLDENMRSNKSHMTNLILSLLFIMQLKNIVL